MALHQFAPPDIYDLRNHEVLLDDFFDFLHDSLGHHTHGHQYVRNDRTMEPQYHARVNVLTEGLQRGRTLIEWNCPHCRQIYTYARYFNYQRNQVRLECHNRDPEYAPNRLGDDKAMIDPLRPPFAPISPEVLARVLRALALSQPIRLMTTPSPPLPESPEEEAGIQDNQPDLPFESTLPSPLRIQHGEQVLNGDPNGTTQEPNRGSTRSNDPA